MQRSTAEPRWSVVEARTRVPADLIATHDKPCAASGKQYVSGCPGCEWLASEYRKLNNARINRVSRAAKRRLRAVPGYTAGVHKTSRDRLRARSADEADADFTRLRGKAKPCKSCGELLPADAFTRNWTELDGRVPRCNRNGCHYLHRRQKQWARLTARWIARGLDPDHCAYCLRPIGPGDRDVDHFIAVARGGTDDPSNLCPSCPDCNRGQGGKFDRDAFEWLAATHPDRVDFFRELFPELNLEPSIP